MEFNVFLELIKSNRSVRRFDASRQVPRETLRELVGVVRYCASGRNLQPLKYRIVCEKSECDKVFSTLKWAGYLPEWDGPRPDERPVAYLVQCLDTSLTDNCMCDDGLQIEALTLATRTLGLASCVIKAFNEPRLVEELQLRPEFKPIYVIALGYGVEHVEIVNMDEDTPDGMKYYRLADGTHCVPKRPVSSLLIDGSGE